METPSPVITYPPLPEWLSQPGHQARLREILADPVYRGFLHFMEERNRIKLDEITGGRAKLSEEIARKAAVLAGIHEFKTSLEGMSRGVAPASAPAQEGWEHYEPKP